MAFWVRLALGLAVSSSLAMACGSDPAKRARRDNEAGAGGREAEAAGAGGAPVVTVAGGGGEGGAAAPAARVDLATYCQTIGESYSAWLTFCYGSEGYPESEAAEFAANIEQRCLQVEPALEAGRVAYDEVAAAACLATIDTMNCDGFTFVEGREECRGVVSGLVALGEPCYEGAPNFAVASSDCASGYCDTAGDVCPGECVAFKADDEACSGSAECQPESWCAEGVCAPRPAVGESCSGDACGFGVSCVMPQGSPDDAVCVARSVAGQACDDAEPCSFGFQCLAGECRSKVATGEACVYTWNCVDGERCIDREGEGKTCGEPGGHDAPCESQLDCVVDHYCGFEEPRRCLPRIAIGSTCTEDGACVAGAWCNLEIGECQASGGDGDSCLTNGFPAGSWQACEADLVCMDDGVCHPVGSEGDPCKAIDQGSCSAGLYCDRADSTCQPPAEEGEPCNAFSQVTCAGDLACTCDDIACSLNNFALPHTCQLRRADGEPCFGTAECAVGSSCFGEPAECTPDPLPCMP